MTTRTMTQNVVAAAALAFAVVWAAPPARAADGIDIDHVEVAEDGTVQVLLGVDGAPDLDSVAVTVDGSPVSDATAEPVEAGQVQRTTILALDASNSMKGDRIEEAQAAARAFLEAAPADVQVGLLTFSKGAQDVIAPTTDHAALADAIDAIELTSGTRVYDALDKAINLAGEDGARTVLLLSDGKDQGGGATLDDAMAAAQDRQVVVDSIALEGASTAPLHKIASASGGDVFEAADPAALTRVFTAEADALAGQVLVTFPQPGNSSREVDLDVSLSVGGTAVSDSAYLSLAKVSDGGPETVDTASPLVGKNALYAGGMILALGLAIALAVFLTGRGGPSASQKRLAVYLGEAKAPPSVAGVKDTAVAQVKRVVSEDFETKLAQRLAGAGMSLTAAEWLLLHAGIVVLGGLAGLLFGGAPFMVMMLILGAVLPWVYLKFKHSRRLAAFGAQLPETLTLMAGSLQAGLSLVQAVDTVVREGNEPIASEFRRALVEHRLGIDVEEALDGVAQRMGSEDFGWVVMAVRIQREVGGNLAEVLNTVADTLREREYLRRPGPHSLSAEGRLSRRTSSSGFRSSCSAT